MKNTGKTLVIGASENPARYSNKAIKSLKNSALDVVAISNRKGEVLDVVFSTEKEQFKDIDTITLYLNQTRQKEYYEYIVKLKPRRVIFNPGTENSEFIQQLKENNIESELACTLVLLSTNQY